MSVIIIVELLRLWALFAIAEIIEMVRVEKRKEIPEKGAVN